MKRIVLILGVLAFAFLWTSTADAGLLDRLRERRAGVERKVERTRKVELHRRHATDRRLPSGGCTGGQCPVK